MSRKNLEELKKEEVLRKLHTINQKKGGKKENRPIDNKNISCVTLKYGQKF